MARGFSLLEVLVSLSLLSVVILGFGSFQELTLRKAKAVYLFFQARQEINNLYQIISLPGGSDQPVLINAWRSEVKKVLPMPKAFIKKNRLVLQWGRPQSESCDIFRLTEYGCVYKTIKRIESD